MSCSKPLPPFVFDSLYYLNRNQLERFSIVCRPLKNFIARYLHSKPYRVFDYLSIHGKSYALYHNKNGLRVHWHPNRGDYSAQQFLAGEALPDSTIRNEIYYSFDEMRPYLGQTIRIEKTWLEVDTTYNPEHIEEMESIAYVWSDRQINVWKKGNKIVSDDFQLILDSPTILQCRYLSMRNSHFSFQDYKVLYNAKIIVNYYENYKTDTKYWSQFLEQPGLKPLVVLRGLHRESINTIVDNLSKTFSSAVSPNAFKIVFAQNYESLPEFRKTNGTSGEKLELKKGLPSEYQDANLDRYCNYTLERCSI